MKIQFWSPRLILRGVRALEAIATHLADLKHVQYKIHGLSGTVTSVEADDTPEDDIVAYTDEHDVWAYQQRVKQRARDGFPLGENEYLPPRS